MKEAILNGQDLATLVQRHRSVFERAQQACRERHCWSPFPETPAQYPDSAQAQARGRAAFEAHLGRPFALAQPGLEDGPARAAEEISPYTQQPLGVTYRRADVDALFDAAEVAIGSWSEATSRAAQSARMAA